MTFTCWTQAADYSQTDRGEITCEQAVELLRTFDWDGEAEQFNRRIENREDACPPGIGFNDSDGSLLHVYLGPEGTFSLHVGLVRQIRFLWLIPFRYTRRFETDGHSLDEAAEAIEDLFHPALEIQD